jgi:phosphatidylglycerophosphate synthase
VRIPTIAVLTGPQPVDGDSVLRADLSAIGATVVEADGPAAAARAVASASAAGRVALVDRRLIAHRHALRLAIEDPRWQAAHSTGVLTVSGQARELLATRLRTLPDLTGHRVEGSGPAARLTAPRPLVPDALAAQLAESLPIHEVPLPPGLIATLVDAPLSARKDAYGRVADTDGEAIRLRRAVKSDDGLFATVFVSSYSRYLARWCARRGLSPNSVTALSLLVAVIGAFTATTGTRAGYIGAAVALYLSFVLDCTDGQLARYALNFSRIGSWLDATFDRAKEYAVYAGLAFGSARNGDDVWLLAALAMALQTVRHYIDFAFHEGNQVRPGQSQGTEQKSLGYWARKVVVLPIGERWALIALLTALATPRTTFAALLIWGVLAAAYTTAGRVQRSLAQTAPPTAQALDALYAMSDILARPKAESRRLASRLGWLVPPTYHALEYAIAIAFAAQVHGALPLAFVYLAAVMYHHYDVVYRIRASARAPRWIGLAGFGFEGRVALLVVATVIPATPSHHAITYAFTALAVYLWALFLIESVYFWVRPAGSAV